MRALQLGQLRLPASFGGVDVLAAADLSDLAFLQGAAAGGRLHMLHPNALLHARDVFSPSAFTTGPAGLPVRRAWERVVSRLGLGTVQTALGITGLHELHTVTKVFQKLMGKQMQLDFESLLEAASPGQANRLQELRTPHACDWLSVSRSRTADCPPIDSHLYRDTLRRMLCLPLQCILDGPTVCRLCWRSYRTFVELTGGSPRVHIYISCSPWRHSLLLSRGRLALSGRKAGVRRVGMIATLAKVPLAFGSVHKRGRTPTDQSPVWQGPSHFQWDACALSLTP
eukprot:COSAG05_NODE_2762_length_2671_cov_21.788880_2_plen_284_part_00